MKRYWIGLSLAVVLGAATFLGAAAQGTPGQAPAPGGISGRDSEAPRPGLRLRFRRRWLFSGPRPTN